MDAVQKVRDLMAKATDERTPEKERLACATAAWRIIEEYKLLTGKRINIDADFANLLKKIASAEFVEGVADRVERMAAGVERIMGSAKKVAGLREVARAVRPKRRRYG